MGGDFSKYGETDTILDLNNYFKEQGKQNYAHVLCVAGNHDRTFDIEYYNREAKIQNDSSIATAFDPIKTKALLQDCKYLEDSTYVLADGDIEVYGSPWTPEYFNWAFMLPRGKPIKDIWSKIPSSTDVLITHGPPLGRGDMTIRSGRAGCYHLLREVQDRIKPRLHVFGHIHEGSGTTFDGRTLFVN